MPDSLPIYTSLSVQAVASSPSATTFQWSADGQACFATKTALYILTPDHGLNFELASTIKTNPVKQNASSDVEPLGWYRTLIQFDRPVEYLWPEHSQDWSAIVLGTVDIALWAITLSPSSISAHAGCVLAALTSSMDFTLWTADRNGLKGQWIFDITPFLLKHYAEESNTARALKSQIICIKWSQQADFGVSPAPLDGSLLIAGNRAGMLLFFRYINSSVELVATVSVSERWVVCLTVSPWITTKPGKCKAHVAYATDDGAVGILTVQQTLEATASPFGLHYTIDISLESDSPFESALEVCVADQRPATLLEWIETPKSRVLVYSKAGVMYLWRPPNDAAAPDLTGAWSGLQTLRLDRAPRLSIGTSSVLPIAGMHYLRRQDKLLICVSDGSFHVLHNVSVAPSWSAAFNDEVVSTEDLSFVARSMFSRVEPGNVDKELVSRVSGMASYDGEATVAWLHEACLPADFSYKHDAKHNSIFVVARLWDDSINEDLLQRLSEVLQSCRAASGLSPAHLLRPIFFALLTRIGKLNEPHTHARILEILARDDHPGETQTPMHVELEPCPRDTPPADLRRDFRASLTRHLYGWDVMLSLRLRLALADYAWKDSDTPEKRDACGAVAQMLLGNISHRVLRTISRHLVAAVQALELNDVPFVMRMVMQSLLPNAPPDLAAEGQQLSQALYTSVPGAATHPDILRGLNESCPACEADIPLHDITSAVCPNGHTWLRCSITTFLLSTPLVRTCVGCSRKAFLPPSTRGMSMAAAGSWLPESCRGWAVEELLEAVQRCLFCGNSFVSVL